MHANCACVCVCVCVCTHRGDLRGESHRSVLLRPGTAVAAQLHVQVQSDHCRGQKKIVPTRVPQRLPAGRHPAQVRRTPARSGQSSRAQRNPRKALRKSAERGYGWSSSTWLPSDHLLRAADVSSEQNQPENLSRKSLFKSSLHINVEKMTWDYGS